jgi:hypothetical protein
MQHFRIHRLLVAAVVLLAARPVTAAMVAPHALFLDHRTRSSVLYVHNPDDVPVEVEIDLVFGYPADDGQGGVRVDLQETPPPGEPSCSGWVRALPRRMALGPNERQAVRLLARPPAGLPDGEYWSRVVVTSREAASPTPLDGAGAVHVGLSLATRTILSLNYRKGPVRTGLDLRRLRAALAPDTLTVRLDLKRLGDAAWLGAADLVLLDAGDQELQRWQQAVAVYHTLSRVLTLPLDRRLPPGSYRLAVRLSTEREDLPPEGILPCEPVLRTVPLTLDGPAAAAR